MTEAVPANNSADRTAPTLRRSLGFWALVIYGVGDILGAGIYALIGKVAGIAGAWSWLSLLIALVAAAFTGLSYAELARRLPRSGGEAAYCQEAFRRPALSLLVGWLVLTSGLVSMATVSIAFAGYVGMGTGPVTHGVIVVAFLVALAVINFLGMDHSSRMNIVCTIVEASGLILVVVLGSIALASGSEPVDAAPPAESIGVSGVVAAAALSFFAFIGFEDMVNVAEEVKDPERNLPIAIVTALVVAGTLYMIVISIATAVVPPAVLGASDAPLLEVVQRAAPNFPVGLFTVIVVFAVANTALLNGIMSSRLLYGMSKEQLLPGWLARVHPRTQTPSHAIAVVLVVTALLALSGNLLDLAGTTSSLLLAVFLTVNVALIRIKLRDREPLEGFNVPLAVPVCGAVGALVLVPFLPPLALARAGAVVAVGVVAIAISSWRKRTAPVN